MYKYSKMLFLCTIAAVVLWAGIVYAGWAVWHLISFGSLFQ